VHPRGSGYCTPHIHNAVERDPVPGPGCCRLFRAPGRRLLCLRERPPPPRTPPQQPTHPQTRAMPRGAPGSGSTVIGGARSLRGKCGPRSCKRIAVILALSCSSVVCKRPTQTPRPSSTPGESRAEALTVVHSYDSQNAVRVTFFVKQGYGARSRGHAGRNDFGSKTCPHRVDSEWFLIVCIGASLIGTCFPNALRACHADVAGRR